MSTANTFSSLQPNFKETYPKKRFSKLRERFGLNGTKPQQEASKNPQKFLDKNKEIKIKALKGIAF